jgi:hypothetical protein
MLLILRYKTTILFFKGNALTNEQFHNANLRYQRTNMYGNAKCCRLQQKKIKSIRNTIQLVGNQRRQL